MTARVPERTCVVCRQRNGQNLLVRVVLGGSGPRVGSAGAGGRGAWVCRQGSCIDDLTEGALQRSFRRRVPAVDLEGLRRALRREPG